MHTQIRFAENVQRLMGYSTLFDEEPRLAHEAFNKMASLPFFTLYFFDLFRICPGSFPKRPSPQPWGGKGGRATK